MANEIPMVLFAAFFIASLSIGPAVSQTAASKRADRFQTANAAHQ